MLHLPACEGKRRNSFTPLANHRERELHPPAHNSHWKNLHSMCGNQAVLRMISGQTARVQAENGDPDKPVSPTPTPVPGMQPQDGGGAAPTATTLPTAALDNFRTSGNTDPDNCCAFCPLPLGVGQGGTASNGMEMSFKINGHRAGVGYDILRTRATSFWENGHSGTTGWTMLESEPQGTNDDLTNNDECLIPNKFKIYSEDRPGFTNPLPRPRGTIFQGKGGATTDADAMEVVAKLNFAEWVSAKDFSAGGSWQMISNLVWWHAIVWLTRDSALNWTLDTSRSEIALGSILSDIKKPPGP